MKITYANKKVEKYFTDFEEMKRKINPQWVRDIKKHINHLLAAENFADFLKVGLGHPEPLKGYKNPTYSLRINANVRMIIEVNSSQDEIMICKEIKIEGVCDYHGDKKNWYIS